MTSASVPSTLVKCLYLFFDLPEMSESEADETDVNSEFTPRERRILLQKIFVQVIYMIFKKYSNGTEIVILISLLLFFFVLFPRCLCDSAVIHILPTNLHERTI